MVAVGGNAPPSMGYESIALLLSYTAILKGGTLITIFPELVKFYCQLDARSFN